MPTLEEINDYEDIDNLDMDLAELDSTLRTPIAPKITTTVVRSQDVEEPPLFPNLDQSNESPSLSFINPETGRVVDTSAITREQLEELKKFQILYPCYFDKNRTHAEGRRVPLSVAVENPLAKTIADACRELNLTAVFEGEKTHPQDFGNPGRVRVLLKEDGSSVSEIKNKRSLLKKIAHYLQAHPTTLQSPREIPYGPDFEGVDARIVPRVKGFKMNSIVPLHSAFMMGHPMTKAIYDQPKVVVPEKPMKAIKNKYKVVRR